MHFDWTSAAIVIATLLGPILAVQIQKHLEEIRAIRSRKEVLFRTLMATRSVRLSPEHVQALNQIDLTFDAKKEEGVRQAWRAYLDQLNTPQLKVGQQVWNAGYDSKFIDMLYEMSKVLGRGFDKTYLKNSWYRPQAHTDLETTVQEIQRLLLGILKGEQSLPVAIREPAPLPNAQPKMIVGSPPGQLSPPRP
jgi:hypothetical protein